MVTKAVHTTQSQYNGTMQTPIWKEPLAINDGLDVVVGEGVCYFLITYLAYFAYYGPLVIYKIIQ